MEFSPTDHPHRRYNPLTGEHVLVSPHRNKRPWLGQTESLDRIVLPACDPDCYLCPGNKRAGGQQNEDYKQTMVFTNDFSAVLPVPGLAAPPAAHPLLQAEPVEGACDVIIFHPRHDLTLARLPPSDIETIIEQWKAIYNERGKQQGIRYVQIFENKGAMMGSSNPHPHGQVWSLSQVPSIPSTELNRMRQYAESCPPPSSAPVGPLGQSCLLCEYAHFEVNQENPDEGRVVVKNDDWVVLVPWWAVWPFETLVFPYKRHVPSLLHLTDSETKSFASILGDITARYDNLFSTPFAYSMGIHQKPIPDHITQSVEDMYDADDIAHLHLHFYPPLLRSATVRKFLVGFELMAEPQRDLTPEQAARRLRDCSPVHYLDPQVPIVVPKEPSEH